MVQLSRPGWRTAAITASLLAGLAAVPAAPALAEGDRATAAKPKVVASGLENPRHLDWDDGALYVAEAGVGGSGPCIAAPENPAAKSCYGASGAITRVRHGHQKRGVKGLPSLAEASGEAAIGPSDLRVDGSRFKVVLGLGADPAVRKGWPRNAQKLGTVSKGTLGRAGSQVVADIAGYEAKANPDRKQIDSNPVGLLRIRGRDVLVDAGGNSLLKVGRDARIKQLATFPTIDVDAPPFLELPPGAKIPMDAVPTAAVQGRDGSIYVSQLTGFPFPPDAASIFRIARDGRKTQYATGLTNVTDMSVAKDGSIYAVQLTDEGLLGEGTGSVVRIPAGGGAKHTTVVDDLQAPYGVMLRWGSLYVSTHATSPDNGQVIKVPLHGKD